MTYLIGWAVITAIYIVSVVLIRKECKKYKQIVTENAEAYCSGVEKASKEIRGEAEESRAKAEVLLGELTECCLQNEKLKMENERLKRENEELDEALEIATRDCDAYREKLIEHGLLVEANDVEEMHEELPPGEIVSDEGEDE